MNESRKEQVKELLTQEQVQIWEEVTAAIDAIYDVDRLWDKGFGMWQIEYKYRRGGKTLCTFYAKEHAATLLITYGKAEGEKFEGIRDTVSSALRSLYDETASLHDGKWLWIPLDRNLRTEDILAMLRIKRRPNRK